MSINDRYESILETIPIVQFFCEQKGVHADVYIKKSVLSDSFNLNKDKFSFIFIVNEELSFKARKDLEVDFQLTVLPKAPAKVELEFVIEGSFDAEYTKNNDIFLSST